MGESDDDHAASSRTGDRGNPRTGATVSAAGWITPLQGMASIGAGVLHAAAVGVHAEHPALARLFVAVAAAQVLVGLLTLLRGGRAVAAATALVNGCAVVAWIVTRVSGISWIEGLEQSEAPRFADIICAALGALAVGAATVTLVSGKAWTRRAAPRRLGLAAIGVGAFTVAAMMAGATHAHSGDADHDHATVYDPAMPIDLSGVDGVTPEQQAFAENLVAVNVVRLQQWADPAAAEAAGFRSIGDAATGHEHYVQWDWIEDSVWLDPDAPESLVYEPQPDGSKQLVSAMYMLPRDIALEDVPDYGGALMQWHIHDDLCLTADPVAPQVEDLTDGTCPRPLVRVPEWAMIHVWIVPHECGPFASLEGGGAGSILEGEERWCDHVHGA